MLIRTLYFEQASIVAAVVCSLIVAGLLKGIIGVGMPVVALPLLSLFIDIKSATMLLSMPLIFSNLPQALEGGKTGRCLMQLMPVFLGMIPGLFLGVRVLLALDANVAKIIAGLVLMGVAGVTLLAPKLQIQSRWVLPTGITFGFFGGILGGIAAMAGPLVFIFLLASMTSASRGRAAGSGRSTRRPCRPGCPRSSSHAGRHAIRSHGRRGAQAEARLPVAIHRRSFQQGSASGQRARARAPPDFACIA